ncbi:MAG TPA: DUF2089 domain-containing protein [Thermotogota bacterium]|nr:DUF2089 domain-containing protein [Thermotogota bacterium]NLH19903.1 DUF2089 domain-containing protein [Thermotogaceae bacterium]OQC31473.1 MAG: hypothetical protein BWX67_01093 [Thermotogota bacterium ADurb.Bin062]HNW46577.1 DUF2089 domain-containing protein [Thermotogota bacterium]HNY82957.1 DUF2089 domain-containing protein [Thermotogota bacterium]
MRKTFTTCPACSGALHITEYTCGKCGTVIRGKFELDEFLRLSEDQLFFLKVFIKHKGNLSEIQKEFEISYPTARNRLEEIIRRMGFELQENPEKTESQRILEMLEKKEITSKQAMEMLRHLNEKEGGVSS